MAASGREKQENRDTASVITRIACEVPLFNSFISLPDCAI
jgi:hypothetical protein